MPICPDKYRGQPEYFIAFSEIITAARHRGTITYQEVAKAVGFPLTGQIMGKTVGDLISEIAEDEHLRGRPLLSAIVILKKTRKPSQGFYKLARDLGLLKDDTPEGREEFLTTQTKAIYKTWRTPIRTNS